MESETISAAGQVPSVSGRIVRIWLKRPPSFCISDVFGLLLQRMGLKSGTKEDNVFHRMRSPYGRTEVFSHGLATSVQDWHLNTDALSADDRGKRAIMAQSLAHLNELAVAFPSLDASLCDQLSATFGENLTVEDSLNCDSLCLGDVFAVRAADDNKERFLLQVTQPRRPCSRVDKRHQAHGTNVRQKSAEMSLAGFFFRPLLPTSSICVTPNGTRSCSIGTLREGDCLVLVERPRPLWTLRRVSKLLYGYGLAKDPSYQTSGWIRRYIQDAQGAKPLPPLSDRDMKDLKSLQDFPELPAFEWLEVVEDILAAMNDFDETFIAQCSGLPSPSGLRRRSSVSKNSLSASARKKASLNPIAWYCSFGFAGMLLSSLVVVRSLRK